MNHPIGPIHGPFQPTLCQFVSTFGMYRDAMQCGKDFGHAGIVHSHGIHVLSNHPGAVIRTAAGVDTGVIPGVRISNYIS